MRSLLLYQERRRERASSKVSHRAELEYKWFKSSSLSMIGTALSYSFSNKSHMLLRVLKTLTQFCSFSSLDQAKVGFPMKAFIRPLILRPRGHGFSSLPGE